MGLSGETETGGTDVIIYPVQGNEQTWYIP